MATGGAAAGRSNSGVRGAVTLSPACGGPQREGITCSAAYADVELRLLSDGGTPLASARTSSTGRFRLTVPAGHYLVKVMTTSKMTRCPAIAVVVTAQAFSVVDIECDSGMR